jgi:hypothetical protein
MSLVPSLLQAIVYVDGEALVMHAGDTPYVVAPTGQIELASRSLTLEAVAGIVAQLLPVASQHALDEFGAVQYELPMQPEFPNEHFTIVAARGGDDVWAEIRRRRVPDEDQIPQELFARQPTTAAADDRVRQDVLDDHDEVVLDETPFIASSETSLDDDLSLPDERQLWPERAPAFGAAEIQQEMTAAPADDEQEIKRIHDALAAREVPPRPSPAVPPLPQQGPPVREDTLTRFATSRPSLRCRLLLRNQRPRERYQSHRLLRLRRKSRRRYRCRLPRPRSP